MVLTHRTQLHRRKGFTLVELLMVILVIGIVCGIVGINGLLPPKDYQKALVMAANKALECGLGVDGCLTVFGGQPSGGNRCGGDGSGWRDSNGRDV